MKKAYTYLLFGIIAVNISACQKELMEQELTSDVAVIDAYLIAGTNEVSVKVTTLMPFTEDGDANQAPIENLSVSVQRDGVSYDLVETANGVYSYSGLEILPGDSFTLNTAYNGRPITASTTVPSIPVGFSLSENTMYLERIEDGEVGQAFFDPLEISWTGDGHYFLTIEYLESSQDLINGNFADVELPNAKTTQILNGTGYNLGFRDLFFFGTYRIALHHVNEEYAHLFENINQSTQNLTNPISNIENGWGVFTSYSSDTLYLEINEL